ncbi:MAG: hypothetical protein QXQ29_02775 [Candidatus Bathyarchaeia archaeon]
MRLRIEHGEYRVDTIALLNSGYETLRPEILLPRRIVDELKLTLQPSASIVKEYMLPGESTVQLTRIVGVVKVSVVEDDRIVGPIDADVAVSEGAEEPLIGDKLAGRLCISVLDFAEGIWCFRDELGRRERGSY